uniref:G-protein coupled receptors family 1 profile domain-containing protein n=1 Tax=Romanomermis culicivorax TaxID=13658 RepID=A0A915K004_ROMCU
MLLNKENNLAEALQCQMFYLSMAANRIKKVWLVRKTVIFGWNTLKFQVVNVKIGLICCRSMPYLQKRQMYAKNYTTVKMLAVFTTSTWFLCAGSNAIVYLQIVVENQLLSMQNTCETLSSIAHKGPVILHRAVPTLNMVNSTENETLVLTVVESRIIGSVYLFVTLAFALPYFACLRVMFIDKTIYNSSLYQIMIHMSFADLFQLIFSGSISSIYSLIYTTDWPIFNKLFSGFAESNWFVYMYLSQVLAANRFLYVFFGVRSVQKVFDKRKTRIFIGICWFLGAVHYAVWSTPGIDFIYDANVGIFYSRGLPAVKLVQNVDLIIDCVHTFVQIIWYTAIYLRIKTKVSNISSDISIVRQNKADQKIMLQAFLLCMSDVVIIVLWQLIGRFVAN